MPDVDFNQYWQSNNWLTVLLLPVSLLYCLVVVVRAFFFRIGIWSIRHFPVPVVVVGNVTVGGTGKTPLVIKLAVEFKARGFQPGIISRGYGGRAKSWPQVVTRESNPSQVGDEPVLIAKRTHCPLVVGPDRPAAARYLLARNDCDIILSDDGLQHYALGRDLEIVVVDETRRFGNRHCLPAGPLREPVGRVRRADIVLINGESYYGKGGFFLEALETVNLSSQRRQLLREMAGKRVHAVAGIGDPIRFFSLLQRAGLDTINHPFPDHHNFASSDITFGDSLPVLMTEKDAIKCTTFAGENLWYVPVQVRLDQSIIREIIGRLEIQ